MMHRSRRALGAVALLALPVGGCSEIRGVEADGGSQAPAEVIVPGGAEVTRIRYTPPGRASWETSTTGVPAIDRKGGFPLLAYRKLCDVNLTDVGLEAPRLVVDLAGGRDVPRSLSVGSTNFNDAGVYTAVGGSPCVYLVATSSLRPIASLAGQEAAAAFRPPAKAGGTAASLEGAEEPEPVHPWVTQARRHLGAGSGGGTPPEEEGADHGS